MASAASGLGQSQQILPKPYKQMNDFSEPKFAFIRELINRYNLSVNWSQCCIFGQRETKRTTASSGLDYSPVDNAYKIALNLSMSLDSDCGQWAIVYHGTAVENACSIAKSGFDGSKTRQGKAYGPGVYLTPSWNIATQWSCDDVKDQDGTVYGVILQCRVRMGSFYKHPLTWQNPAVEIETDLDETEYVVPKPEDNIIIYGILLKPNPHRNWNYLVSLHSRFNALGDMRVSPSSEERGIYDFMIQDITASRMDPQIKSEIKAHFVFMQCLFDNREDLIRKAVNRDPIGVWRSPLAKQLGDGSWNVEVVQGVFHAENTREFTADDKTPSMQEALSYIHNVWTKAYLKARKDDKLAYFFNFAGLREGNCIDGRTQFFVDKFISIQDVNYNFFLSVKNFTEYYQRLGEITSIEQAWLGRSEITEELLRTALHLRVGQLFQGCLLDEAFVKNGIQYFKETGLV